MGAPLRPTWATVHEVNQRQKGLVVPAVDQPRQAPRAGFIDLSTCQPRPRISTTPSLNVLLESNPLCCKAVRHYAIWPRAKSTPSLNPTRSPLQDLGGRGDRAC